MTETDYDDPAQQQQWIDDTHVVVVDYLRTQNVPHGGVASIPTFLLPPIISIWKVMSQSDPEEVAWWAISGDCPNDYIPGSEADDVRKALARFAQLWLDESKRLIQGHEPALRLTQVASQDKIAAGEKLQARARIMQEWADDAELWRYRRSEQTKQPVD